MAQSTGPDSSLRHSVNLMDLPLELHLQITSRLIYPDALALKHSCHHFYCLVCTGVHLKVDWLVERVERKLECPMEKCSFRTDEIFCNGRIQRIMERRRWHLECQRAVGGCSLMEGQTCRTDLVPFCFMQQSRRMTIKFWAFWGREALVIAIIAVFMEMAWRLVQKYKAS